LGVLRGLSARGTVRGARRAPGPTTDRARGTKTRPTSIPAFRSYRADGSLHPSGTVAPTDGQLLRGDRGVSGAGPGCARARSRVQEEDPVGARQRSVEVDSVVHGRC